MTRKIRFTQLDVLNGGHETCNHVNYKLTCEQYERLLHRAAGRCELCGRFGIQSARGKLHIDHDHEVGWWAVRGLLCSYCNCHFRRPWMDTPKRAAYLRRAWYRNSN